MTPAMIFALASAAATLTKAGLDVLARLNLDGGEATPEEIARIKAEAEALKALQAEAEDDWAAQLEKMRQAEEPNRFDA